MNNLRLLMKYHYQSIYQLLQYEITKLSMELQKDELNKIMFVRVRLSIFYLMK